MSEPTIHIPIELSKVKNNMKGYIFTTNIEKYNTIFLLNKPITGDILRTKTGDFSITKTQGLNYIELTKR